MRLLYHCGRFRNHGYTTFFGGGEPIELTRAAADRLLQAVEKGQALPGSTGVLRRLTAEGREICEVVLFDHGRAPTQSQDAAIQLALDRLLEGDLAVALKSAVGAESFSAGEKLMGDALDKALPALARIIGEAPVVAAVKPQPVGVAPPPTRPAAPRGNRMTLISGVGVGVLALAGIIFILSGRMVPFVDKDDDSSEITLGPSQETMVAIEDFLRECYGEQKPELVKKIAEKYAGKELRRYSDDGKRDRLQLLDEQQRKELTILSAVDDKHSCNQRQELWAHVTDLRTAMAGSVPPFAHALESLERDAGYFALTKAAQKIATLPSPPPPPTDCAEGHCLPIIDPADMAARDWIREIYKAVAVSVSDKQPSSLTTAEAFVREYGGSLRRAEVEFLGEAALMGVAADRPAWLKHFWNCERQRDGCEVPLLSVQDWFSN